jgi:hypothetical protein
MNGSYRWLSVSLPKHLFLSIDFSSEKFLDFQKLDMRRPTLELGSSFGRVSY